MKPFTQFHAVLARVTEDDVLSDSLADFAALPEAERAINVLADEWDGATIYEIRVTWDRDELGPVAVEHELSCRNYVKGGDGQFILDEVIASR